MARRFTELVAAISIVALTTSAALAAVGGDRVFEHKAAPGMPFARVTIWACPSTGAYPAGVPVVPTVQSSEAVSQTWGERKAEMETQGCEQVRVPSDARTCWDKGTFFNSIDFVQTKMPGYVWGGTECHVE